MSTLGKRLAVMLSAVTASLLVAAPAATANASDSPPLSIAMSPSPSTLLLSVSDGEQVRFGARTVVLRCQPAGGNHPKSATACAQLAGRGGDFAALNVDPGQRCILLYAPVTVTALGTWHDEVVRYQETFGNSCMLHAKTGAVFQF